jgi:UDP-2,3-diacylglucosamine pyrophosphatase LpxH
MNTIVSASDFHIHDDSKLEVIKRFTSEMDALKPDILIFLGDIGDPWEATWGDIRGTQSWKELEKLSRRRRNEELKTVWVNRNHDYSARRNYLSGTTMVALYSIDDFLFMHGWEFDWIWNGFDCIWNIPVLPGISGIAYWLSSTFPGFSIRLWSWLGACPCFKKKTPYQTKARVARDDWTKLIGLVHFRAMDYAQRKKVKLVIGHTHCPMVYEDLLADDGDMVDSFSFIYIQDGKWKLRTIQLEESRGYVSEEAGSTDG